MSEDKISSRPLLPVYAIVLIIVLVVIVIVVVAVVIIIKRRRKQEEKPETVVYNNRQDQNMHDIGENEYQDINYMGIIERKNVNNVAYRDMDTKKHEMYENASFSVEGHEGNRYEKLQGIRTAQPPAS